MVNFFLAEGAELEMAEGDHWSMGSLENLGEAYGDGTIGLDWASPIEGEPDDVICPIVEENIPALGAKTYQTSRSVRVVFSDIGAETYAVTFDEEEAEDVTATLERKYPALEPNSEHTIFVEATNSRNNTLSDTFFITLVSLPIMYRVIKGTFLQKDKARGQICAFMARITDVVTDEPLSPSLVDSISYTAYRLIKNTNGTGREFVEGFSDVPVPNNAVLSGLMEEKYWTRDDGGFNFFHIPDQIEKYLLPDSGAYQIEYEIRLKSANPIFICYDLYAN